MRVLISGSHGLVGSALSSRLEHEGNEVLRLARSHPQKNGVLWDPVSGTIDAGSLKGLDAVIHLAGDPIAEGRWTPEKKARIRDSRVNGTRLLSTALASVSPAPKSFLCASAVGIYGNRGDEILTETASPGSGFLADVGREWESAAGAAREKGIRVVHLRFGIILAPHGGALKKMVPPFKMGLGGPLGGGRQFMSWITLEDVLGGIRHILGNQTIEGPVNMVSPEPVRNREFSMLLAQALHRPAFLPMPAFGARLLFGEMADEALLASARAVPEKLLKTGYTFRHPALSQAFENIFHAKHENR